MPDHSIPNFILRKQLILNERCFSNIKKCKLLSLNNFIDGSALDLKTSMFTGSYIETLFIKFSNYNGIRDDSNSSIGNDASNASIFIKNFIIDSCYINKIDKNTLGHFESLKNAQIQNSNVESIEKDSFADCCSNLVQLHLNANSIKTLMGRDTFKYLNNLLYLDLDSNPLALISKRVLNPIRPTLKKLNLKSTNLISINEAFYDMFPLEELILSNMPDFEIDNLYSIITSAPNLKYLDLNQNNMIVKSQNLNAILDKVDYLLDGENRTLSFIDISYQNVSIDENAFKEAFDRSGLCLWRNVLDNIFVQVDPDHECNCGLFFLYRNILKFSFPYNTIVTNISADLNDDFLHKYFKINLKNETAIEWEQAMLRMPKCYRKLWLQYFDLDQIRIKEFECGFQPEINLNCTHVVKTTISTTKRTSSHHKTTPTKVHSTTSNSDDLYLNKKFNGQITIPIVCSLLVVWVLVISVLVFKARYDYKKKFLGKVNATFYGQTKEPKELNSLATISYSNPNYGRQTFHEYANSVSDDAERDSLASSSLY